MYITFCQTRDSRNCGKAGAVYLQTAPAKRVLSPMVPIFLPASSFKELFELCSSEVYLSLED